MQEQLPSFRLVVITGIVLTMLLLVVTVQTADAIKGSGQKNPETNSKKVCGDKLCEKPMSIKEKIDEYTSTSEESSIAQQAAKVGVVPKTKEQPKKTEPLEKKETMIPKAQEQPEPIVPKVEEKISTSTVEGTQMVIPQYQSTFHIEHQTRFSIMQQGNLKQEKDTMSVFLDGTFAIQNEKFVAPLQSTSVKFFIGKQLSPQEGKVTRLELSDDGKKISYDIELIPDSSGRAGVISGYLQFENIIVDPTRNGCFLPRDANSQWMKATITRGDVKASDTRGPTVLESIRYSCYNGFCSWQEYPESIASIDFNKAPDRVIEVAGIKEADYLDPREIDTPLRKSLKEMYQKLEKDQIRSENLPRVVYDPIALDQIGNKINKTAKTVVVYDDAKQAGFESWPQFILKTEDSVINYTQLAREKYHTFYQEAEENGYDLNNLPRNVTIVDTEEFLGVDDRIVTPFEGINGIPVASDTDQQITQSNLLFGKTVAPPERKWGVFYKLEECISVAGIKKCIVLYEFNLGFKFEAAAGLRLPVKINMNSPTMLEYNTTYNDITLTLIPVDGDQEFYENVGLESNKVLSGHEHIAYLKTFVGFGEKILGQETHPGTELLPVDIDLPKYCKEASDSRSWSDKGIRYLMPSWAEPPTQCRNFVTPFGIDENGHQRWFPIPHMIIKAEDSHIYYTIYGVTIGGDIILEPNIGSRTISAEWTAEGDSCGAGEIIFTGNSPTQQIGPILVADFDNATNKATIKITEITYHFDALELLLRANILIGLPPKDSSDEAPTWLLSLPESAWIDVVSLRSGDEVATMSLHDGTNKYESEIRIDQNKIKPMLESKDEWVRKNLESIK